MSSLAVNRRLTSAFIAQLPVSLVLTPRDRDRTGSGGFAFRERVPRAPQRMTLIESTGEPAPTVTLDGVVRVVQFELVAEWDAALARYDTFEHGERSWEVIELFYENGYERRALVSGRV